MIGDKRSLHFITVRGHLDMTFY